MEGNVVPLQIHFGKTS